ncbi:hypothetical protein PFISCL1PPCAC_25627, partial [Pristionchus fissidentatus]
IIRVRRKRGAEPAEALVLSLKRARTEDEQEPAKRVMFSLWKDAQAAPDTVEQPHRLIDWELGGRGAAAKENNGLAAAVAAPSVPSSPERNENVEAELSFVSDDAIGEIGEVDKQQRQREKDDDVIMCNGAPLRPAAAAAECDDVFDFYRVAHPNGELAFMDEEQREIEIAVATKQEMLAYIGAMDGVEGESDIDSEDSNDENNWRNEYPDESSEDEEGEDGYDDYGRRRRRDGDGGNEEYGSSDGEHYGGEDTEDSGEDELAENWRNFRIG